MKNLRCTRPLIGSKQTKNYLNVVFRKENIIVITTAPSACLLVSSTRTRTRTRRGKTDPVTRLISNVQLSRKPKNSIEITLQ